ncbi:MAG: lysine--tRNA ligase [Planctomycetes bacterium]|jgi:lysyl-tRNA synthetase class 2|nr:lysine--tRNA ligase [Planctomycetota bacterium]MDP6409660.1 lysine--tRNA ligase [Planctomycetota bacterium]
MTELAHPDRLEKVRRMRAEGLDPYPPRGVTAEPVAELIEAAGTPEEPGPRLGETVTVTGRLLGLRDFGKLIFAPLAERSGRIQVGLQRDRLGEWWPRRKLLDGGDLVGISGELGHTQKGQVTVWASEVRLLAKALAPPPEKWHGLTDKEQRYRRRYVDLWAGEKTAGVFIKRSRALSIIRRFLEEQGYLEVETPTLHPLLGGAAARPFVTHHNALGMDLFLRIAPELYLKRLIVGGLERVFEVSRNFRNEGLSVRHNPEFTMLELYEAQADYRRMMELTEQLFELLALELCEGTAVPFRGRDYSFAAPFERRAYTTLFREANGCEFDDEAAVRARAGELGIEDEHTDYWKLMSDVFDATVEGELDGPVFVTGYPVGISPLSKASTADPRLAERFEVFVAGMELGNAFTELNDPQEQQRRFEEQVASLDPETPGEVDIDYIQALEYGMPPCGGLGIGVDRLLMVLCNQESIRDVLLFPAMRPVPTADSD